jgi:hypothetical protein
MAVREKIKKPTTRRTRSEKPTRKATTPKSQNISDLGRKLMAIRKEIIESGIPLLTEEEIARERAEQRRERY